MLKHDLGNMAPLFCAIEIFLYTLFLIIAAGASILMFSNIGFLPSGPLAFTFFTTLFSGAASLNVR